MKDVSIAERGWTLDVLNGIRSLGKIEFTNGNAYTLADYLEKLQVLRDAKLLIHVSSGVLASAVKTFPQISQIYADKTASAQSA